MDWYVQRPGPRHNHSLVAICLLGFIYVFSAGSINLLCVPFGSLASGMLSNPLGKRRVMQVSMDEHEKPLCSVADQIEHAIN